MNKKCLNCKQTKSTEHFSKDKTKKDGLQSHCKPCRKNYMTSYKKEVKLGTRKKITRKTDKSLSYIKHMISDAIRRAKKKNIQYNIDQLDPTMLKIPTYCPILGIKLFKTKGRASDNSPSLDRIYSDKGYMIDNIHIISWKANRIKNDATTDDLRKIVDYFEKIDEVMIKRGNVDATETSTI